ncbi:MAG: formate/nitrite transporter family protein [Actinomycetota bacterium]|nr:formate/nitrite transporter family protein [Actinomycetota bacterium]HZY65736.1 formate/nitrite transporter family protein [Rubrobacteraceae bacterium]
MASSKSAGEILETVVEDGQQELERANVGLAFSGFVAGLNISFSGIALVVVGALTGGIGFAAYAAYPIGFLIVILGRAQLFTENTVTPVVVVLSRPNRLLTMLRLWGVVLLFNILGAAIFAAAVVYGKVLEPAAFELLLEEVSKKMEYGFWATTIKGVFGGWLVALVVWMVAASRDTISQALIIYLLIMLIPATGLAHCVAGSSEILMSVFAGETAPLDYLGDFLVPATLGNGLGGFFLVTLLNYGQVIGSQSKPWLRRNRKDWET